MIGEAVDLSEVLHEMQSLRYGDTFTYGAAISACVAELNLGKRCYGLQLVEGPAAEFTPSLSAPPHPVKEKAGKWQEAVLLMSALRFDCQLDL